MWPGFDSRSSRRHMWVEFVVGSRPCSDKFFFGFGLKKQHCQITIRSGECPHTVKRVMELCTIQIYKF